MMARALNQPPRMTPDEVRLIRQLVHDQGRTPTEVAVILNRGLSSVCRQLEKARPAKMGRPAALNNKQIDKLVELTEAMVAQADANHEVSLAMALRRSRFKISSRTAARVLHKRGYRFRKLRAKMILTPQDVIARYDWAKKYKNRSRQWWLDQVHIHLDNHHFKHATLPRGRQLLAKRHVRGAYRKAEKRLTSAHRKPRCEIAAKSWW